MAYQFRAVALDYDGTIAEHDHAQAAALEAVAELRRSGRRVLLVTGRILEELRAVFPDVDRHFDALIAENGGVVVTDSSVHYTAEPLPAELYDALRAAAVPFRAGHLLIATDAVYADTVLAIIERLGVEAQLVYNRGALMVVPGGVSKGAGLLHTLGLMEVSRHSTITVGDAENDHSLLAAGEIGVAVGNAVPALRAHADICLDAADGAAVAAFLRGPVLSGDLRIHPERWQVEVGAAEDGSAVRLPGSRVNVLIAGASCSGKSHMAGLLVERLTQHDYSVCVLDAEGDHTNLEGLPGVITVGGRDPLPPPTRLASLVRHRFSSVIVDLSLLQADAKRSYCAAALRALHALRLDGGYPHWIVIEEADQLLSGGELPESGDGEPFGYCLVTHRPLALQESVRAAIEVVLALPGAEQYARIPVCDAGSAERPFVLRSGQALLASAQQTLAFDMAERALPHVRHRHKYTFARVAPERRFFFGRGNGERRVAANIAEFRCEVRRAGDKVLFEHLRAGDFSRWVRDVIADDELGARLRNIERWLQNEPDTVDVGAARMAVVAAIDERYGPNAGNSSGTHLDAPP